MAVNKVVYGGVTMVDLTSDTVSNGDVVSGKKFHLPDGSVSTGTLNVVNVYSGSDDPSDTLGSDGDLYFKV